MKTVKVHVWRQVNHEATIELEMPDDFDPDLAENGNDDSFTTTVWAEAGNANWDSELNDSDWTIQSITPQEATA